KFSINLPVMSGFVDTLLSKIDDPPIVNFGYTDLADLKRSLKVSSAWKIDSDTNHGNWNFKDRCEKKLAIFSGRGITKYFAESDPKYKSNLDVIDHNNFLCEPKGGGHLSNHSFMGEQNIWKTKTQLEGDIYDQTQVNKLFNALNTDDFKKNEQLYKEATERFDSLGLDIESNTYVGVPTVRFIEWYMTHEGERYYLLFEYSTGIWVRAHKLSDVFESNEWPYVSWATNPDAFNFWSKAPADDARPLCEIMDVLFTQTINNRQKINAGMRGYDFEAIPDPSQLEYRPDGLVEFKLAQGRRIQDAVYEFKTEGLDGTIDLMGIVDSLLGRKTGITSDIQGSADEDMKVGVYFGNLQQVADRLGLFNKSYKEAWAEKGLRYWHGLKEHLTENMAVKMIGSRGIEWDDLTKEDLRPITEFDITITGGSSEERLNEVQKREKKESLMLIQKDPDLKMTTNLNWLRTQILMVGGYDEADIKMAADKENEGNLELFSEAEQAIQDILQGREPQINRGANTAFIKYIMDFALDKIDFGKNESDKKEMQKKEWYMKLMEYAEAHVIIAAENMARMANMMALNRPPKEEKPEEGKLGVSEKVDVREPSPETPEETMSMSQKISGVFRGMGTNV
ncbi:MAG: portal protein, partial [Candidatus Heimdallarchaeaceae archaeon]